MNAELIAVGTELLLGQIADTDGQYISRRLAALGINVFYHTVVGDNPERFSAVLALARQRSDLIITTGGLGPTYDDLTKELLAQAFGLRLAEDRESLARIRRYFAARGKEMTENNRKQALLPEGCTVFANDWGTAPGCAFTAAGVTVAMLPGPPRECEPMTDFRLVPYLAGKTGCVIYSDILRVCGAGESEVEHRLKDLMRSARNPTVAPYCKLGEVELRVTARAENEAAAKALNAPVVAAIKQELQGDVYGVNVSGLAEALVNALRARGCTFATAESCTGGLVAQRITDVPGCSDVFLGSVVSYANSVKQCALGVKPETLAARGAVSPETAAEMVTGLCARLGADVGVSLTGIAGPTGGTPEKPVGLVWVGVNLKGNVTTHRLLLGGPGRNREDIRALAATRALKLVLDRLVSTISTNV